MDNLQTGHFVLLNGGDFKPLYLILENLENGEYNAWSCPPTSDKCYCLERLQVDLMPKEAFSELIILNKKKSRQNPFILSNDEYSIYISKQWTKENPDIWSSIQALN